MQIELRKISVYERMSEETTAFAADLYVDGKNVGTVKNDGHGGCNDIYLDPEHRGLYAKMESYCKTLPPEKCIYGEVKIDLDLFLGFIVERFCEARDAIKYKKKMTADMAKGVVFKTPNGYSLSKWKGHTIESLIKHPQGVKALGDKIQQLRKEGHTVLNTNLKEILPHLFGG